MSPYWQVALTTGLTLVAAVVVVSNAEVYHLAEGFSYTSLPYATVTAQSRIQCSLRCAAVTTADCDGFQFLPDGACLLYLEDPPPVCSAGPVEPTTTTEQVTLTVSVSLQTATYRRLRNNTGNFTDACACPNGFQRCANHCYFADLIGHTYTYTAAEQYCADLGAILATPRSAPENTCAKDVAAAAGVCCSYFWLGYRNNTVNSFAGADGGGAMNFANWNTAGGDPHLYSADNCVALNPYYGTGLWYDNPCNEIRYALCQARN